jgi:hypothetical protein
VDGSGGFVDTMKKNVKLVLRSRKLIKRDRVLFLWTRAARRRKKKDFESRRDVRVACRQVSFVSTTIDVTCMYASSQKEERSG